MYEVWIEKTESTFFLIFVSWGKSKANPQHRRELFMLQAGMFRKALFIKHIKQNPSLEDKSRSSCFLKAIEFHLIFSINMFTWVDCYIIMKIYTGVITFICAELLFTSNACSFFELYVPMLIYTNWKSDLQCLFYFGYWRYPDFYNLVLKSIWVVTLIVMENTILIFCTVITCISFCW